MSIDIALNPKTNAIDIGVRCEGELMGVGQIRSLVEAFVGKVHQTLQELVG